MLTLFIPGGRKKYKSKTIPFTLPSSIDLGHLIDVIPLLSVILNKHNGIGISSMSSISCKFLASVSFGIDSLTKSKIVEGLQLLFLILSHSATIDTAHVYNFE